MILSSVKLFIVVMVGSVSSRSDDNELREVGTLSLSVMIESAFDVESSGGGFVCTL